MTHSARRARRVPSRAAFVVGAVLVACALSVEGALRHSVEARLAKGASCQLDDAEADVADLLIGPGLMTGNLGDVLLDGRVRDPDGVPARVEVRLENLGVGPFGNGERSAENGSARVTIAWSDLADAMRNETDSPMGEDVTLRAEAGSIVMEGPQVTVLAAVALVDGTVVVTPHTLRAGGQDMPVARLLPVLEQRSPYAAARLQPRRLPLRGLPAGASPTTASARDDGLVVDAALAPDVLFANADSCT